MTCLHENASPEKELDSVKLEKVKDQHLTLSTTESASEGSTSSNGESTRRKRDHDIQPMKIVFGGTTSSIKEPITGIAYPDTLNGYSLVGCGVRTKYFVFHAYAVGFYLDLKTARFVHPPPPLDSAIDVQDKWITRILLDPSVPRIFRLVMNRNITSAQYISATFEVLTPLMKGKDLDKLEEMKKQEMPQTLTAKTEIYILVMGSTLTLQVDQERAGRIESNVLTRAVCENYLGEKPVSPAMKKAALVNFHNLLEKAK